MDSRRGCRFSLNEVPEVAMVPLAPRRAVLFFGHAGFAYGHISRCHKIARRLVEEFPFDAYIVSSCPEYEPEEPHEAIHEVLIPGFRIGSSDLLPDRLPISDRVSSLAHVPTEQFSAHRGRLLLALAARIRPHAVLLEGFPFVRPLQALEECGPTLAYLSERSPQTLRCGGFNGVPTSLWTDEHGSLVERMLRDQLDRLFVYVDPAERTALFERSPWLQKVAAKVHLMGYVVGALPEKADAPAQILATFGGGVDAFRKIVLVVEAFFEFSVSQPGFSLHVVTGGQLPDKGYREVVRRVAGRADVRLTRVVPGLARRLNHYRLVISMGGYNACTELYQASTRSIVLPRFAPDFGEQMEQARKFHKAGAVDWIMDAGVSSPGLLAEVMARTLAAPPSPRLPVDVGGADATAKSLASEPERRRPGLLTG
jgi:predicted glycosyltransferase